MQICLGFLKNDSAHLGQLSSSPSSISFIHLPPAAATSHLSSLLLPRMICQPVKLNISLPQLPMKYFTEQEAAKLIRCLVEVETGCFLKTYHRTNMKYIVKHTIPYSDMNGLYMYICCMTPFPAFVPRKSQQPGPRLNIKTVLSTYGDFHVKDKTAVRTSYL